MIKYIGELPGPEAIEDEQTTVLPELGKITKPSEASKKRIAKTLESKRNGAEGAKGKKLTSAASRTGSLIEDLTESIDNASMKSPESVTRIQTLKREEEGIQMAAKKKTAAKKTAKVAAERAPGRERKLLLRLSNSEYDGLTKLAEKNGVPMAQALRDGCNLK